jgi:hypothetical protein
LHFNSPFEKYSPLRGKKYTKYGNILSRGIPEDSRKNSAEFTGNFLNLLDFSSDMRYDGIVKKP